ncbi:MAG: hypothetical protein ACKVQA_18710 [Burkholderiales bacterium]
MYNQYNASWKPRPSTPARKSPDYNREEIDDAESGLAAAYAKGDHTLQAIAGAFGVHYATASRAVNGE